MRSFRLVAVALFAVAAFTRAEDETGGAVEKDSNAEANAYHTSEDKAAITPGDVFTKMDTNKDGKISHDEIVARLLTVQKAEKKYMAAEEKKQKDELDIAMPLAGDTIPKHLKMKLDHQAQEDRSAAHFADQSNKEEYKRMDTDGDKRVTWEEIVKEMFAPPDAPKDGEDPIGQQQLDEMAQIQKFEKKRFEQADSLPKDGKLTLTEFTTWRSGKMPDIEAEQTAYFREAETKRYITDGDKDGDKHLDMSEMEAIHDWFSFLSHPPHLKDHLDL